MGSTVTDIFEYNRKGLKVIDILKIGVSLMKSVRKLHGIGFVHLDLKPDNMMFDTDFDEIKSQNRFENINKI